MACPTDTSACCSTYTFTVSGSPSSDGAYQYAGDGAGTWTNTYNYSYDLTCSGNVWSVVIGSYYGSATMTVANTTGCPPTLGWTISSDPYGILTGATVVVSTSSCPVTYGGTQSARSGTPTNIGGCVGWYDAEWQHGIEVYGDGEAVDYFIDGSGTNRHGWTYGGTTRPTIDFAEINSLSAFRFTHANTTAVYLPSLAAMTAGEIFAVIKPNYTEGAANPNTGMWHIGAHYNSHYGWSDGNIYDDFGTNNRKSWNPTPSLAGFKLYNVYSASSDWQAHLDGTSTYSTSSNTVSFGANPKIGRVLTEDGNGLYAFDGWFAEIIIFNRKLTTTERGNMNYYVAQKYGMTIANQVPTGGGATNGYAGFFMEF